MIYLIAALPAEANPLIRAFNLRHNNSHTLFRVYSNDTMMLVITGVGKMHSAAACAWLHAATGEAEHEAWLNIGVAGHTQHPPGMGFVASKITDIASETSWYPSQLLARDIASEDLITVDQPEFEYKVPTLYDMEASGFYTVASKLTTSELILCYKIVSDNREHHALDLNAKQVEKLITDRMDQVNELVSRLNGLCHAIKSFHTTPECMAEIMRQWHFSVTQTHKLKRLLTQWTLRSPSGEFFISEISHLKNSREILRYLERGIKLLPVNLMSPQSEPRSTFE